MPIRWKLKELAERRHLSGYALADKTGISRQTLYKLMRQPLVTRVNAETLATLCDRLNVQPSALLAFEREKKSRR
jgi:DNA-binding Xre family transcriptional regulator